VFRPFSPYIYSSKKDYIQPMRTLLITTIIALCCHSSSALHFAITESGIYTMGQSWTDAVAAVGHTSEIISEAALDNTDFFPDFDALIVSTGVTAIGPAQVDVIKQFLQTGKPVYLQSEYLASYQTNIAFASLVNDLGGVFAWTDEFSGDLSPMNVSGYISSNYNIVNSFSYYWYSVSGEGNCSIYPFLDYGGGKHGFQFLPLDPSIGTLITTSDQDWVQSLSSPELLQNIVLSLLTPPSAIPGAVVDLGDDQTICPGDQVLLNAYNENATYLWQDNSTDSTFNVTETGVYSVLVTIGSCSIFDEVEFTGIQGVDIIPESNIDACAGDIVVITPQVIADTYLWQDNSTNSTFTATLSGDYWVQIGSDCGVVSDTVHVEIFDYPTFSLGPDDVFCNGNNVLLSIDVVNAEIEWSNGSNATSYTFTQPGIYWAQASISGCVYSDSIYFDAFVDPIIFPQTDLLSCVGSTILLNPSTFSEEYLWQDNSVSSNYTAQISGDYTAQLTTVCGVFEDQIHVDIIDVTSFTLGPDRVICENSGTNLAVNFQQADILWNDGSSGNLLYIADSGLYWAAIDVQGCMASDTVQVSEVFCEGLLEMPNIFSPNGDDQNEYFKPFNEENVSSFEMTIFNRWGQSVYSGKSLLGWDGEFQGKTCSEGVYYWIIEYTFLNLSPKNASGNLTLIR
jgi:gliding motility-associated-like protein